MDAVAVPRVADEKTMLLAMLDGHRAAIVRKVEGLTDEQARAKLVPSLTTLGGLVKHLAGVEQFWVRRTFAGEDLPRPWSREDPDSGWRLTDSDTVPGLLAMYDEEVRRSQTICSSASSFDVLAARQVRGEAVSLRWIVAHLIEETARHAGHADILREQLDGATGL